MGSFKQAILRAKEEEMPYLYFISKTSCIGLKTYIKMQDFFASPREFYETDIKTVKSTGAFSAGQLRLIEECRNRVDIVTEYNESVRQGIKLISIDTEDYPKRLKTIKDAPPVLFLKGRYREGYMPSVSIIGARECSV